MAAGGGDDPIAKPAGPPSADRLPTLTEVVELPPPAAGSADHRADCGVPGREADDRVDDKADEMVDDKADLPRRGGWYPNGGVVGAWPPAADLLPRGSALAGTGDAVEVDHDDHAMAAAPAPPIDPDALVARVLQALAPRVDLLFEARLRDAVAPAFARAADALVRDAREDFAAALRALVEQAVADEVAQRQAR